MQCSKEIFFANSDGVMFSQQQFNLEPDYERRDQVVIGNPIQVQKMKAVTETPNNM